jgi:hypothetical protein
MRRAQGRFRDGGALARPAFAKLRQILPNGMRLVDLAVVLAEQKE